MQSAGVLLHSLNDHSRQVSFLSSRDGMFFFIFLWPEDSNESRPILLMFPLFQVLKILQKLKDLDITLDILAVGRLANDAFVLHLPAHF